MSETQDQNDASTTTAQQGVKDAADQAQQSTQTTGGAADQNTDQQKSADLNTDAQGAQGANESGKDAG